MSGNVDAVVIGAGVAGSTAAILLALSGWRVALVEQHDYPRRKVCGECIAPGNLSLLDTLGIGPAFRTLAGPEIRRVGWMDATRTITAPMPPSLQGAVAYGRALGRDRLDALLVARARELGVQVRQPARVQAVSGAAGRFECHLDDNPSGSLCAPVVIDAHGSWERPPSLECEREAAAPPIPRHAAADLLAFKATYRDSRLAPGFLPVLALPGGYGGMVLGDSGQTTLACCIRRDALMAWRRTMPGVTAGDAVEAFIFHSVAGVRDALAGTAREGGWLAVGPLRPGCRVQEFHGIFRVGNAAGESHPLIGEGISMALQSSALLAATLRDCDPPSITGGRAVDLHRAYAAAWRRTFDRRLRLAALYAHIAMRPALAVPTRRLLQRWPQLLGWGARIAGKTAPAVSPSLITAEIA